MRYCQPVVIYGTPQWQQAERHYLKRDASAFVSGLHVDREGEQLTVAGSTRRWGDKVINGSSDAYVVRLRRDANPGKEDRDEEIVLPVQPIEPEQATPEEAPW